MNILNAQNVEIENISNQQKISENISVLYIHIILKVESEHLIQCYFEQDALVIFAIQSAVHFAAKLLIAFVQKPQPFVNKGLRHKL